MEVVHARVFHSGIVSVSYPTPDAAPHVVLTTWDGAIHTGKIQLMRQSLQAAARPGTLLECVGVHAGPPLHSDVCQYASHLQVGFRSPFSPCADSAAEGCPSEGVSAAAFSWCCRGNISAGRVCWLLAVPIIRSTAHCMLGMPLSQEWMFPTWA